VKFWVFKDAGYWRQYERVHDELTEDKEIAAAVFGREFARAYNAALGENLAESDARRLGSGGGR
jgi:predicted component of type VI protein secretion system